MLETARMHIFPWFPVLFVFLFLYFPSILHSESAFAAHMTHRRCVVSESLGQRFFRYRYIYFLYHIYLSPSENYVFTFKVRGTFAGENKKKTHLGSQVQRCSQETAR